MSPGLHSLCQLLGCLYPGYGLCGFPWVVPLVGYCLCPGCGLFILVPLDAYVRVVDGVLVCLSSARGVGLVLFGWYACWHLVVLFRADAPSYVYRGDAVRLLFSLMASALYSS